MPLINSVTRTELDDAVGCPALPGRRPSGSVEDEVLQISMKLVEIFGGGINSLNPGKVVPSRKEPLSTDLLS